MTSLTALTSTFLYGRNNLRLVKTFRRSGEVLAYPMAKNFTSETKSYALTQAGLRQRLADMQAAADKGGCMLKGELSRELDDEPRAGLCKTRSPSHTLILDIDKLAVNPQALVGWAEAKLRDEAGSDGKKLISFDRTKHYFGANCLRLIAEHIIQTMFPELSTFTYFMHTSSSMGVRNITDVSMHLEFVLDTPVLPEIQKDWLRLKNLATPTLTNGIKLSKNGASLLLPLDASVADNSKLIFIAHPTFEDEEMNPVANENRIMLIEKDLILVPHAMLSSAISPQQVKDLMARKTVELRKAMGMENKKFKTRTLRQGTESIEILLNPDAMNFTIEEDAGEFVHANVNGGDSNAYYWPKSNPEIVYNFKGEPAFRLRDANEEFYLYVIATYAEFIIKREGRQCFVRRREDDGGRLFGIECCTDSNKVYNYQEFSDLKAAKDFVEYFGGLPPESLPFAKVIFDPTSTEVYRIDVVEGRPPVEVFNIYTESELWLNTANNPNQQPTYDTLPECLRTETPATMMLIRHVFNYSTPEIRHFLNWLTAALHTKQKLGTTWIMQGVQGTGKGILWEHVIVPLFGKHNTKKMTVTELEDKFDKNLARKTMVLVDEFRHSDAQGSKKLENKLKLMATEASYSLRGMHTEYKDMDNFFQMIFFSNNHDAGRIDQNDRRYNVSPRQEIPLWRAMRTTTKEEGMARIGDMIEAVEKELPKLANVLRSTDYSLALARVAMDNEAKHAMQKASRTKGEDFMAALQSGDFEYFLSAFASVPRNDVARFERGRKALLALTMAVKNKPDNNAEITLDANDLLQFYNAAVTGKDEPLVSLEKYLMRFGTIRVALTGTQHVVRCQMYAAETTLQAVLTSMNRGTQNVRPEQPNITDTAGH